MPWPPRIGDPLPRAEDVWCTEEKLVEWVLGRGHGEEWRRLSKIGPEDRGLLWGAIKRAVVGVPIDSVRPKAPFGASCRIRAELTLGKRSASIAMVWHYPYEGAAPRLVTAHPKD